MTTPLAAGLWINAREATLLVLGDTPPLRPEIIGRQVLESEVPAHHKAVGQVSERGGERHGGGGPRSARENHRLEHLRAWLVQIKGLLPACDLLLVGDGPLAKRLGAELALEDAHHHRDRRVAVLTHQRLSEPQLAALLREFVGTASARQRPTTNLPVSPA
jgi:hypothetical protein